MKPETIFSIASTAAMVGWILLVVAPRWRFTRLAVLAATVPLMLSVAYLLLIVFFFGSSEGGFDSLENVMKLFTNQWVALAGWIHYLAFDMFVGSWEVRDSQKQGISHWFVIPCLILTFLLGPIGLLAYTGLRFAIVKRGEK